MQREFSVIVPAYNRADLIAQTLDAILAQTCRPREVIVVDDGSTDGTRDAAARYGDPVRTIAIANGGAAAARQVGAEAAQGRWLAFCDSDDLWRPQHLEELGNLFTRTGVPYAFTNFVHVRQEGWAQQDKFAMAPAGYWTACRPVYPGAAVADAPLFPQLLRFQPIFPSCIAMTREFYRAVGGFDPAFGRLGSEDLEFALRCCRRAPAGLVTRPTVGIRRHAGNDSRDSVRQLAGEITILRHVLRSADLPPEWRQPIREEIGRRSREGADAAFAARRFRLVGDFASGIPGTGRSLKLRTKIALSALAGTLTRDARGASRGTAP